MKKAAVAVLTALTVLAMGSMTAFAASPTVGTTEAPVSTQAAATSVAGTKTPAEYAAATTVSDGYDVAEVSQTTVESAKVAVQNELLNDLAAIGRKLNNSALTAAATDGSQKVTAQILSVVDVTAASAAKDADGNYVVKLGVSGISAGDAVAVLHYNGSVWETIVPAEVANGQVTFKVSSLSPIAVVKLSVSGLARAPKTGETLPMAALIVVAGLAGAAVCGKRYFA